MELAEFDFALERWVEIGQAWEEGKEDKWKEEQMETGKHRDIEQIVGSPIHWDLEGTKDSSGKYSWKGPLRSTYWIMNTKTRNLCS